MKSFKEYIQEKREISEVEQPPSPEMAKKSREKESAMQKKQQEQDRTARVITTLQDKIKNVKMKSQERAQQS